MTDKHCVRIEIESGAFPGRPAPPAFGRHEERNPGRGFGVNFSIGGGPPFGFKFLLRFFGRRSR